MLTAIRKLLALDHGPERVRDEVGAGMSRRSFMGVLGAAVGTAAAAKVIGPSLFAPKPEASWDVDWKWAQQGVAWADQEIAFNGSSMIEPFLSGYTLPQFIQGPVQIHARPTAAEVAERGRAFRERMDHATDAVRYKGVQLVYDKNIEGGRLFAVDGLDPGYIRQELDRAAEFYTRGEGHSMA